MWYVVCGKLSRVWDLESAFANATKRHCVTLTAALPCNWASSAVDEGEVGFMCSEDTVVEALAQTSRSKQTLRMNGDLPECYQKEKRAYLEDPVLSQVSR